MTINQWPVRGRPRYRLEAGEYIAQIIGRVEHLSYGSDNNAEAQAIKWFKTYGYQTPQWHYRFILKPLSQIDTDTGEVKDVSHLLPQLSKPYAVTSSNRGLMTVFQSVYSLTDTDGQLYDQMIGKVIKVRVKDVSNTNFWELATSTPIAPIDPTKLTEDFIYWSQDGDKSLADVMPTEKIAHTIQSSIDRAELTRLKLINSIKETNNDQH